MGARMIDSHVHLNHADFGGDLDHVMARAKEAGITKMVNIGFDLGSSRETVSLAKRHADVFGAVGVHPHDAATYDDEVEQEIERLVDNEKVIAVGEIGLDYYRDLSPRETQRDVFRRQLALARRKNMPVIIHCRDAFDDVIHVLSEEGERYRGIFHAFTGDHDMAGRVLDLGFHIGIGGVVTFKNSGLAGVVAELPPDSFVLETDCPYLTPAPFRGKRNEPAYLVHVLEKIADATGRSRAEIVAKTDESFASAMGRTH
jgi:TatD DNase family protein